MFQNLKKDKILPQQGGINIISSGTEIVGQVNTEGDIRVDGKLEGSLKCGGKLIVGIGGFVNGPITAKDAEISGKVSGSLVIQGALTLKQNSLIEGDMEIGTLIVEAGASFLGKCTMYGQKKINNESGLKMVVKNNGEIKTA